MKNGKNATKAERCCAQFKTVLFSIISTFGLLFIIVIYSVAGAFLFSYIEQPGELRHLNESRYQAAEIKQNHINELWEIYQELLPINSTLNEKAKFIREIEDAVNNVTENIYRLTTQKYWDGRQPDSTTITKWDFPGSFLFAVTAITTIGYGHITPKTDIGQVLTIFYCLFGLPITIMYIAKLGKVFASVFRVIYHTCCCGVCCLSCLIHKKYLQRRKREKTQKEKSQHPIGALVVLTSEESAPKSIVIGGKTYKKYSTTQIWLRLIRAKYKHSFKEAATVPIYISLFIMWVYIFAGAVLFHIWEDDWDLLQGFYFCFVTLTSIGFGDFVPGVAVDENDQESTQKLVITAVYVFIGLAFIGMCIDLMQADVVAKAKWLGDHIGVTKKSRQRRSNSEKIKAKVGAKLSMSYDSGSLNSLNFNPNNDQPKDANKLALPRSQSARCLPIENKNKSPSYHRTQSYHPMSQSSPPFINENNVEEELPDHSQENGYIMINTANPYPV